nr:LysR family transcriptional regulator [Sphingomonas sp. CDS-1]
MIEAIISGLMWVSAAGLDRLGAMEDFKAEFRGMTTHRLPSLNALRAFDAVARHGSFTAAAKELCVTHGAVSRHISILEDSLGVKLFIRGRAHDRTDSFSQGLSVFDPASFRYDEIGYISDRCTE